MPANAKETLRNVVKIAVPILATVAGFAIFKVVLSSKVLPLESVLGFGNKLGPWGPVLFVVILGIRPLVLLPGQVFTAVAGMIWGTLEGSAVALAGSALSGLITLYLGKRVFGRLLVKWARVDADKLHAVARKHDLLYGLVMTMNPLVPTDVTLIVGAAAGASWKRLLVGSLIGNVPGTLATAMFGRSVVTNQPWAMAATVACWVVSAVGAAFIARRVYASLAKERLPAEAHEPKRAPKLGRVELGDLPSR